MESTGECIFGVDLGGHCVFIDRCGARLPGFELQGTQGRDMHKLTHHSHADGTPYPDTGCPIFNAFHRGLPCRIDSEVFWRRDGSAFADEYSSYPIIDGQQVCGAVITFTDITERKRDAEALRRANDKFELRVAMRKASQTRVACMLGAIAQPTSCGVPCNARPADRCWPAF